MRMLTRSRPGYAGQHAQTTRERRRGARPLDFDLIGTEFHRWVRDHKDALSLKNSAAYSRFIQEDFDFYSRWYERIRKAEKTLSPGLEAIHFNAWHGFTLQRPTLLAPLLRNDSDDQILHKLRIVAAYLDILIALRIWNWRSTSYSTMQYAMFQLVKRIRGKPVNELADILVARLHDEGLSFDNNDYFSLHGRNGPQVHQLLARMTDYVEICSGQSSRYAEYIQRSGRNGYQIEHIWADHPERHMDEFDHPTDFGEYRNRIGGLLLLPRSFNASYGDLDYGEKREYYNSRNLLARSLHEQAYHHNPGFRKFMDESGLPFQPHATFKRQDLDARQELYRQIGGANLEPGYSAARGGGVIAELPAVLSLQSTRQTLPLRMVERG